MFGIFPPRSKVRALASGWLETAEKVWRYRHDVLAEGDSKELRVRIDELRRLVEEKADAVRLAAAVGKLETVVQRTGGAVHPKTSLSENVEFLLIAAIVFFGFRTYFVQFFVIPTNSMWPTYNGMTPEVFARPSDEPGPVAELGRILAFEAWPHRIDAPVDGEVLIPVRGRGSLGYVHCKTANGRSWLIIPSKVREYTFLVDDQAVTTHVPLDFDLDWAVYDAFFGDNGAYSHVSFNRSIQTRLDAGDYVDREIDGEVLHCVRTGRHVKAGERMFAFDEMAGDKVAVDRISYNFVRPCVGSGFVFRTGKIPGFGEDIFLIKRLVGVPGDTLEVKGPTLYRNGAPITGSTAFEANSLQLGNYTGYVALGRLAPGSNVHVEPGSYFAMGDNSSNSRDGRYWGFVPGTEVVGRPIFVYFPLTKRWGVTH
jgi:signal peptidase I